MKTAEDLLKGKGKEIISVSPETTIADVVRIMVQKHIASIVIKREGKILGMWSERDLLQNILTSGFDPKKAMIGDYMITAIPTAPHTDTVYQLADKYIGMKVRHLLITKDEEYIGLLSVGDIMVNALQEKEQELKALKAEHSFDYYEDWQQWKKKK